MEHWRVYLMASLTKVDKCLLSVMRTLVGVRSWFANRSLPDASDAGDAARRLGARKEFGKERMTCEESGLPSFPRFGVRCSSCTPPAGKQARLV
jgi:hypothetical protein